VNADAFFHPSYDDQLREMVQQIVAADGPIKDAVLARRIARAHGWQRTGTRIQERVSSIAHSCLTCTEEDVGVFFWANDKGPEVSISFIGESETARSVDEICMAELVSLANLVIAEGKFGDNAVVSMAKRLGMHHVRAASRGRLEKAIEMAKAD
jgi:hypothetical protein